MNKDLEALKEIENHLSELHKKIDKDTFIHLYEMLPFYVIEKSLKALEIIKERNIDVSNIKIHCADQFEVVKGGE